MSSTTENCDFCREFGPSSYDPDKFFSDSSTQDPLSVPWRGCLKCRNCDQVVGLWMAEKNRLSSLPSLLSSPDDDRPVDGWLLLRDESDVLRHLVLALVVYRHNEPPDMSRHECEFSPIEGDEEKVVLLWKEGIAVGFATVKVFDDLILVDSVYVRKRLRGSGMTRELVTKLLQYPETILGSGGGLYPQDLGFSSPLSDAMFCVLMKMLLNPEGQYDWKERMWLVPNVPSAPRDEKLNIWWLAPKLMRERGIHLPAINVKQASIAR